MNNSKIDEKDIWAYLSDEADIETRERVERWKNSETFDETFYNETVRTYQIIKSHVFDNEVVQKAKGKFFESVTSKEKSNHLLWRQTLKYAASVILLISFVSYWIYNSNRVTLQTGFGEKEQVQLADGSVVWLNANTTLTYSSSNPRSLYLDGEAFFEVAKNKEIPFVVDTRSGIQVTALGTSFNIKSYEQLQSTETILMTGKVSVTSDEHFDEALIMMPGDRVLFSDVDKSLATSRVDLKGDELAWRNQKIRFKNQPFYKIVAELNARFGVKITIKNEQLAQSRFTATFEEATSIQEILETLQLSKSFVYQQLSDKEWVIK